MMKRQLYVFIVILMISGTSCEEIFEKDISSKSVVLLAPMEGLKTTLVNHTFWWDYVEGADEYELQIVTPSFDQTIRLLLDTTISANQFAFVLTPGEYEWRVRALNYAYCTNFTIYNLIIDSTLDLTNETVMLNVPSEHDTLNSVELEFVWEYLYNAELYNLQVVQAGNIVVDTNLETNRISPEFFTNEGPYLWRVKAENSVSETKYSSRNFFIDTSSPSKPVPYLPLDYSIVEDTLVLIEWKRENGTGSSEFDSVFLYEDESLIQLVGAERSYTRKKLFDLNEGDYFWNVRAYDRAGNKSELSECWTFRIER